MTYRYIAIRVVILKKVKQCTVSDHLLQCNCAINFDDFDMLVADSNNIKLLLKVSLLIKRDKANAKQGDKIVSVRAL